MANFCQTVLTTGSGREERGEHKEEEEGERDVASENGASNQSREARR